MKPLRFVAMASIAALLLSFAAYRFGARQAATPAAAPERFPILPRVELARDYGYFIGDVISLTLVIETTADVVLDLVNLPHKGEMHGLFEVRDLTVTTTATTTHHVTHRAAYSLQYFGPTPVTAPFGPLEILYALPEHQVETTGSYTYKSVFTQPAPINMARIGPHHRRVDLTLKGPVEDERAGMIRAGFALGTLFSLIVLGSWAWGWRQQRRMEMTSSTRIAATTLQTLRLEGERFRPIDIPAIPAAMRLHQLIRDYVQEVYALPALTLTTAELQQALSDTPYGPALCDLLARCDHLTYQAPSSIDAEEQQLWWEAITLFEKLQCEAAP